MHEHSRRLTASLGQSFQIVIVTPKDLFNCHSLTVPPNIPLFSTVRSSVGHNLALGWIGKGYGHKWA